MEDLEVFDEWLKVNDPERYERDQAKDRAEREEKEKAVLAAGESSTPLATETSAAVATQNVPAPSAWRELWASNDPAPGVLGSEASPSDPALHAPVSKAPLGGPAWFSMPEKMRGFFRGWESVTLA